VPEVRWSDIGGLNDIKEELIEAVIWPMKYPDIFKMLTLIPLRASCSMGPREPGKLYWGKRLPMRVELILFLSNVLSWSVDLSVNQRGK